MTLFDLNRQCQQFEACKVKGRQKVGGGLVKVPSLKLEVFSEDIPHADLW